MAVVGTALSALGYAAADAILSTGSLFLAPLRAIANGLATFFSGTLLAPTKVVDAGATSSAESFLTGKGSLLGPAAFPIAVLMAVAGVYVLYRFIVAAGVSPTKWFTENDG